MISKQDSDEIFEMAANAPSIWREQAGWLKTAAQLHLDQINSIREKSTLSPADRSDAIMPHFQAYMMLTSFAFENLIKAIIVSRNPGMAIKTGKRNTSKLNTDLWPGNGHNIADIIPGDIPLDFQEKDLLTRLQAFAVWAGRYPTSVSSDDFHAAQGELNFKLATDPALAGNLFLRLTTFILNSD